MKHSLLLLFLFPFYVYAYEGKKEPLIINLTITAQEKPIWYDTSTSAQQSPLLFPSQPKKKKASLALNFQEGDRRLKITPKRIEFSASF